MSESPNLLLDAAVAWDKHVVTFNLVLARLRAAEAEVERLRAAVELALDLAENELVDFKKYGLKQDSDIPALYRAVLRGGGE